MELIKYEDGQIQVSQNVVKALKEFEKKKVEIEIQEKQLKEELLEAMEKHNVLSWKSDDGSISASYRKATKRVSIDTERLKKELPDIAEEYSKESDVKSSVALKIEV